MISIFLLIASILGLSCDNGCENISNNEISCCTCNEDVIGFIDLDGCAIIDLDWDELDIDFTLELNNTILFETTFGFNHPPELCIDIWGMEICALLEDLSLLNNEFTGCLHLLVNENLDINLGCWDLKREEPTDLKLESNGLLVPH